ncbi:MAG: RHS repeat-associated core domain-containing protein [Chloroflexota bacterium]
MFFLPYTCAYSYDANGNLIGVTAGGETFATYRYDAANRLKGFTDAATGIVSNYTYDGMGDRYQQTVDGVTTNYLLDPTSGLTQVLGEFKPGRGTYYLLGLDVIGQQQGTDWSYFGYDALGSVRQLTDASGNKLRFKQLVVEDRTWTQQTVNYSYDKLSRLLEARYAPGINEAAEDTDLLRRYLYAYDRAGNRLSQSIALDGGSPSVTNDTYNGANQLSSGSAAYDDNGNLTSDGTNSYTWDRANRLVEWDNGVAADLTAYAYDGLGNRIAQLLGTTSPTITKYLLDLQPGLAVVLAETTGADVIRNIHSPRGIHAHKDAAGAWEWMVQDGLGSVHGVVDNSVGVLESRNYDPYGVGFDATGSNQTVYGFTGEPTDDNGLLYLRARYYNPAAGVFTALDPFEGVFNRPMSLNGYSWVEGNVPNAIDPSGKYWFLDTSSDLTKKMPLPDLSDVRVEYYLSKLIQTEALGNPFIHAEYPVLNDNFIDLLGVNDAERKIRYWEIKANNPNGISTGKASILDTSLALPIAAGKGELSSTHTTSVENPGYTYDWNSYTWSPGFNYPLRVLGQSTDGKRYWFARQGTEPATGSQIPGLITYWYEEREDDPKDIPWFLGIARRNIPDDIPQRPRVPNNIIPLFPTEEEDSGEPAAAACGLVPSPGGFHSFYQPQRFCIGPICFDIFFIL